MSRDGGFLRELIQKSAARSIDLAADFLLTGFSSEHSRLGAVKRAYESANIERAVGIENAADATASKGGVQKDLDAQIPLDSRAEEEDEEETSNSEADGKSASLSACLMKIARDLILPTSIAAIIAAKKRDDAEAATESANGI